MNQIQIPIPDTKPKYKQFSFWLPIITPFINFSLILIAAKYPTIGEAIKKSGLDSALNTVVGGSFLTSAAYIFGEKHKDGKTLAALATNNAPLPVALPAAVEVPAVLSSSVAPALPVNDETHYTDNANAG